MGSSIVTTPRVSPADWPLAGAIDLRVHDLPHASSTTEWWYLNTHLTLQGGRQVSLFAAFFRIAKGKGEFAHSLTWAISDLQTGAYLASSRVDEAAPTIGLEKIKQGHGSKDARLNRAMTEVLHKGKVPAPDRSFVAAVSVATDRLALQFGPSSFTKKDDGSYRLELRDEKHQHGCELDIELLKPALRHGDDGLVRGVHGEDMFYYFVPRCAVRGAVQLHGERLAVQGGSAWYDHEFGCPPVAAAASPVADAKAVESLIAWDWVSLQLDDGTDVSVYSLVDTVSKASAGRWAILSDKTGRRYAVSDFTLEASGTWRSTRTFQDYPTSWQLTIPELTLQVSLEAAIADQEFVTVLSKPAFWEGRVQATGTLAGTAIAGVGYVERSGFSDVDTLDDFFVRVGESVRASVASVYPLELTESHAQYLAGSPDRPALLDGVDLEQLAGNLLAPVRLITDRNGKGWRSYAALACCDVVGGDSRLFAQWLAMPELIHVGSLIVDDVEDESTVRRGGPTAHLVHGEPIAINAGTAAYFLGERLLKRSLVTPTQRLQLYDLYFEAMRSGHAGQAIDLAGLQRYVPIALETGDVELLERRVLAVHRLKTAAPASALARMGAVAGGGTQAQIAALGDYFESVGLAFQIIDDVLNLRGFERNLKTRAEDLTHGKVTLPVARAIGRLPLAERSSLWTRIACKPTDIDELALLVTVLESCGAVDSCVEQATALVEQAWLKLDPLVDESLAKVMLRSFGWYVLERHY